MEKSDFPTLLFAFGILTFLVILTAVKVFSLNIDNTNLIILLFTTVCVSAFSRIEKHEVEVNEK
jgi:hypothetical protein